MKKPNLQQKGKSLYYVKRVLEKRKWTKIGTVDDMAQAMDTYRRLCEADSMISDHSISGMLDSFRNVLRDPRNPMKLADKTIKEYLRQLRPDGNLCKAFGHLNPADVRPIFIGKYLELHSRPVTANREIALLSRIYSYNIGKGADLINPCLNIQRNLEDKNDRYVQDWEFCVVRDLALPPVALAMDISYLTGLRLSDVLGLNLGQYDSEYLRISEGKTSNKARIIMSPVLFEVLESNEQLPGAGKKFAHVVRNRKGDGYTLDGFESLWQRTMKKAIAGTLHERFKFHDIRAKHATDKDEESLNAQLALGHSSAEMTKKYLRHPLGPKMEGLDLLPNGRNRVEGLKK